jgi:serine/threonine-protein kinase Chk1
MLLDFEGNLKLADFGLAELFRYQGREKKLLEACGSAPYAAPEVRHFKSLPSWSC